MSGEAWPAEPHSSRGGGSPHSLALCPFPRPACWKESQARHSPTLSLCAQGRTTTTYNTGLTHTAYSPNQEQSHTPHTLLSTHACPRPHPRPHPHPHPHPHPPPHHATGHTHPPTHPPTSQQHRTAAIGLAPRPPQPTYYYYRLPYPLSTATDRKNNTRIRVCRSKIPRHVLLGNMSQNGGTRLHETWFENSRSHKPASLLT